MFHVGVGSRDRMLLVIDYLVYKEQPSGKRSDVSVKEGV